MLYAKISDGEVLKYPYTVADLRADNPQVSFPANVPHELMLEFGASEVIPAAAPTPNPFQVAQEIDPVFENGAWRQAWVLVSAPVPASITRRQCALKLLDVQYITAQEALEMTKTATLPAAIAQIFDAQVASGTMTPEQRVLAEIDFAAANYYRDNSLLGLMGLTDVEIDQFFIAAAQL